MPLKDKLIKLAAENPELRAHLVPILKTAGAVDFSNFGKGTDPKKVFLDLIEKARFEHGHGGYSGSIAEKSDFVVKDRSGMTRDEAEVYVNQNIDRTDKWGPAWAIAIIESKDLGTKELTGTVKAKDKNAARQVAEQDARGKIKQKPGTGISVRRIDVSLAKEGGKIPLTKIDPSSVVPETWAVRTVYPDRVDHDTALHGTRFTSKDQAVAEIDNRLKNPEAKSRAEGTKMVIYKITPVSGVQVGAAAKLPTWEYKVQVSISQKGQNIIGWLFFGMASS